MEKVVKAVAFPAFNSSHENKWVALSSDKKRIVAVGNNLTEVLEKTRDMKKTDVIKVPSSLGYAPKTH